MLLALAGRWESGNVHIGQQGSVLGLPMDHLKIDELKKARNDSMYQMNTPTYYVI